MCRNRFTVLTDSDHNSLQPGSFTISPDSNEKKKSFNPRMVVNARVLKDLSEMLFCRYDAGL